MTIGEKIRELRKKNDLTQEKTAERLGVSFQAISKWETGISCPDLSLIGPLTKLFGVSADELLGLTEECSDGRRERFDRIYREYRKNDDDGGSNYHEASDAVREFPTDYRYLEWLATSEYKLAFSAEQETDGKLEDCREFFEEMMENSMRHYETVIDNCADSDTCKRAVIGMVIDLEYIGRTTEAEWYADVVYPKPGLWAALQKISFAPVQSRDSFIASLNNPSL